MEKYEIFKLKIEISISYFVHHKKLLFSKIENKSK